MSRTRACRRIPSLAWALVCLLAFAPAVHAAGKPERPEGLSAGPWIVAPYLSTGYEANDNLFQSFDRRSDRVRSLAGGLTAALPFRNSMFEIDYEISQDQYGEFVFPRDLNQDVGLDLDLRFRNGIRLGLRDEYERAFAQDVGTDTDLTFDGTPFNSNRWEVQLLRDDPRRWGFDLRVRRLDFVYDTAGIVDNRYDFRGFDNSMRYRFPLGPGRAWTLSYQGRRVEQFVPRGLGTLVLGECSGGGGEQCEQNADCPSPQTCGVSIQFQTDQPGRDLIGSVCRREATDGVLGGISGRMGQDQPYDVRLGYSRFRYSGAGCSTDVTVPRPNEPPDVVEKVLIPVSNVEFTGLVGAASLRFTTGPRSDLELRANRRPLPSSSSTYYINQDLVAVYERDWTRLIDLQARATMIYNRYGPPQDLEDTRVRCGNERRRDLYYTLESNLLFRVHERLEVTVGGRYGGRSSNCDGDSFEILDGRDTRTGTEIDAEYTSTIFNVGVKLGWF